jgi:hypothetical protein
LPKKEEGVEVMELDEIHTYVGSKVIALHKTAIITAISFMP